jgi:hypothetical protein
VRALDILEQITKQAPVPKVIKKWNWRTELKSSDPVQWQIPETRIVLGRDLGRLAATAREAQVGTPDAGLIRRSAADLEAGTTIGVDVTATS